MKDLDGRDVDSTCEDNEEKFDFSVMSYNILSQDLLEDNSHLYRHCRRPVLHWSFRFPNILKEIKHFDADVSMQSSIRAFLVRRVWLIVHSWAVFYCMLFSRCGFFVINC